MNLTELQIELRSIEERIELLHSEIEKMKPKTENEEKGDFVRITRLAEKHPLDGKKIAKEPVERQKIYLYSLSCFFLTEGNIDISRLLYLCRISKGCGLELSAEELYKNGIQFDKDDLDEVCSELYDIRYSYITDAMILANIAQEDTAKMAGMIADIAVLMQCDKDDVCVMSDVAKCYLADDFDGLKKTSLTQGNRWGGQFKDFIPKEWIEAQRRQAGCFCIKRCLSESDTGYRYYRIFHSSCKQPYNIKWILPNGSVVRKGEKIFAYTENKYVDGGSPLFSREEESEEKVVSASVEGILFSAELQKKSKVQRKKDKDILIYIVSVLDEYSDFCAWLKEREG